MKKITVVFLAVFSLIIFLPSTASAAGPCTEIWEVYQEAIDHVYVTGITSCDGDPGCYTEIELAHNISSTGNDIGWALCCVGMGGLFC